MPYPCTNAIANGTATNAVQAVVTDAHGNPVAGQLVNFTADNNASITTVTGTTGADGIATATLTSTTATVNGHSQKWPPPLWRYLQLLVYLSMGLHLQ